MDALYLCYPSRSCNSIAALVIEFCFHLSRLPRAPSQRETQSGRQEEEMMALDLDGWFFTKSKNYRCMKIGKNVEATTDKERELSQ
jgi:hypothetical protein